MNESTLSCQIETDGFIRTVFFQCTPVKISNESISIFQERLVSTAGLNINDIDAYI